VNPMLCPVRKQIQVTPASALLHDRAADTDPHLHAARRGSTRGRRGEHVRLIGGEPPSRPDRVDVATATSASTTASTIATRSDPKHPHLSERIRAPRRSGGRQSGGASGGGGAGGGPRCPLHFVAVDAAGPIRLTIPAADGRRGDWRGKLPGGNGELGGGGAAGASGGMASTGGGASETATGASGMPTGVSL
jgi:hypothetical protein